MGTPGRGVCLAGQVVVYQSSSAACTSLPGGRKGAGSRGSWPAPLPAGQARSAPSPAARHSATGRRGERASRTWTIGRVAELKEARYAPPAI